MMSESGPFADLVDTLYALTRVMEKESEMLALFGSNGDIAKWMQAKLRLAAQMEQLCARLARENALWMEALDDEERAIFAEASDELHKAATVNSAVLEQHISLSVQMVQAVEHEMERLTGRRGTTSSRLGDIKGPR